MKELPRRKKLRRGNVQRYNRGVYFVTICTGLRRWEFVFGRVKNGKMIQNQWGSIAEMYREQIPNVYPGVSLRERIIMPDHMHGIVVIDDKKGKSGNEMGNQINTGGTTTSRPYGDPMQLGEKKEMYGMLSRVIKGYKGEVAKEIHRMGCKAFKWHRSFYDKRVKDRNALENIEKYIRANPKNWNKRD